MAKNITQQEDRAISAISEVQDIIERLDEVIQERDGQIKELEAKLEAEIDRANDLQSQLDNYKP